MVVKTSSMEEELNLKDIQYILASFFFFLPLPSLVQFHRKWPKLEKRNCENRGRDRSDFLKMNSVHSQPATPMDQFVTLPKARRS